MVTSPVLESLFETDIDNEVRKMHIVQLTYTAALALGDLVFMVRACKDTTRSDLTFIIVDVA